MPRLQVMASNEDDDAIINGLYEDAGQGSDTFDLCASCAEDLEDVGLDGDEWPGWLALSIDVGDLGIMLTDGVEHPTYEGDFTYQCCSCEVLLNHKDD
jgi:hypothetical protein